MQKFLRPVDLARAAGLSTQAVRDYERWGFLPSAQRSPHGYRQYTPRHLFAIRTARTLIAGYGWEHALRIMQYVHQDDLSSALAALDARHAALHQNRFEIEQTLKMLQTISHALPLSTEQGSKGKSYHHLHVGEVAKRAGVRVSAVRFWEEQGLIHPIRDSTSRYRLYDEQQVGILQIVVLLRKAGYNFEAIRLVLTQLEKGSPEQALQAAENRQRELADASKRCAEATAAFWAYVEETVMRKS